MNINQVVESGSEQETETFARTLAQSLMPGVIIALHGDLGAGKTVFTRGFARGLGVTEAVSSPTYTILQEYPLANGQWLYHLDLYRINGYQAALAFGIEDYLDDPDAFIVLEWPLRIQELLPPGTINVHLEHVSENVRRITVEAI